MKHLRIISILLLVIFTGLPEKSHSCICFGGNTNFLATLDSMLLGQAAGYRSLDNFVVVKGLVVGKRLDGDAVYFQPLHYYYHAAVKNPVTIWGTDGTDCYLSVSAITPPTADTVFLIMYRMTVRSPVIDTNDYSIIRCGNYYATVRNDSVFGGSTGSLTEHGYPLSKFEDSLRSLIRVLDVPSVQPSILNAKLFPNPAKGDGVVRLQGTFDGIINIRVCNGMGQVVFNKSVFTTPSKPESFEIPLKGLAEGFYMVIINGITQKRAFPFVIVE